MKSKFIGFALARMTLCISGDKTRAGSIRKDNPQYCYEWVIYSKMGEIEEDQGKINIFWHIVGAKKGQKRGIHNGPYGYIHKRGTFEYTPIHFQEEWDILLAEWRLIKEDNDSPE